MRRLLGLMKDVARSNFPGGVPYKLTYIVTEDCSCRCTVCRLWRSPAPGAGLDEIRELFRNNPHLSWINLSGGDVVERDDFCEIVQAAVESTRVYALDFPTAGQQPAEVERRVREVLRLPLPRLFVTVSLDGPEAIHDRLRGVRGAFTRGVETHERLSRIEDRRLAVYVGLTLSSANDSDPEQLTEALLREVPGLERDRLHFNIAHHAPHYYRNKASDRPDRQRTARFLEQERRRRRVPLHPFALLESSYWRLARSYLETGRSPLPCAALSSAAFVDPHLQLFPCATWDRPLLDLREVGYSLARAVEQARVQETRARAVAGDCPGCWTPCEAYPTLLANISRLPGALLSRPAGRSDHEEGRGPIVRELPPGLELEDGRG